MDRTWFLFGFKGRINRAKYWFSALILIGWMLFIAWSMYLGLLLAVRAYRPGAPVTIDFGIDATVALISRAFHGSLSWIGLIPLAGNLLGTTVFMWILLATSIKRLHDRDRGGWWIVPFVVLPCLAQYLQDWLPGGIAGMLLGFVLIALSIWSFVELACLRGSPWTNRFGPNPLGKTQNRPRSGHAFTRGAPGWDQRDEIEFVPRRGSPPPR